MAQQSAVSVQNNFTKGLLTEFTGLNFPENAATDCDNVTFTLVGDVLRRHGIDLEDNYGASTEYLGNKALGTYRWTNVAGDGNTEFLVVQIGNELRFYETSAVSSSSGLSNHLRTFGVDMSIFAFSGLPFDPTSETQFSSGNGYLFVFNSTAEPFYVTYTGNDIIATAINVQIRDFVGVLDGIAVDGRPVTLEDSHSYNLLNQGWSKGAAWTASSTTSQSYSLGSKTFTVDSGLSVVLGDQVTVKTGTDGIDSLTMSGTVTTYSGTSLTININSLEKIITGSINSSKWLITPINHGYTDTWKTAVGNYPSNSDVWWNFKDSLNAFNPAATYAQVGIKAGAAPKGHFIMSAFYMSRGSVSAISSIDTIGSYRRPRTGTWFQGRIWYAGTDAFQPKTGVVDAYSWSENIYFSQIAESPSQFGMCYQVNDPTSEELFDLLPSDGGVIRIQGSGTVYKLFPIDNGLLVFAANGIWFVTGSQGIGFTANDYTITKISSVRSFSGTSFVDVQGMPYFWNEEGIYAVSPRSDKIGRGTGSFDVEPITVGTIQSFYDEIPMASKRYVRGAYHPIDYVIQWVYRGEEANGIQQRYQFNKILNYNVYNKSFYPYTISENAHIHSINYLPSNINTDSPSPKFKYLTSYLDTNISFSEEKEEGYIDWESISAEEMEAYFVTGYSLKGQALKKFQAPYIYVYSRNDEPNAYKIQGIWDYAITGNSGKWSAIQQVNNFKPNFGMIYRRHKIRGHGLAMQIKVNSVSGMPFDIMGWSALQTVSGGV